MCGTCGAVKARWQAATPEERARERDQSRRSNAKLRKEMRTIIVAAKDKPCVDCNQRFPACVMDLDHVRGAKRFKVSEAVQLAYAAGIGMLLDEIGKCAVVCTSCHRLRTEARGYRGAKA